MDTLWYTVGAVDGTSYMLPFYNYALAMLYRKDLNTSNSLNMKYKNKRGRRLPKPRYNDLGTYLDICTFMTRDRNGDGKTDLWGASMQAKKGYKITEEWTNYLYAAGGDIISNDTIVLDKGNAAVTALRKYKTNLEQSAPPEAKSWGFNQARQLMQNGNAFNMLTYNWMLGRLSDTQIGDKIAIAEVPGSKAVLGAWGWAIPHNVKNEAHADAAWKFLSWVESPTIRKKRALMGGAPTCTDTLNNKDLLNKYPQYYPVLEQILKTAEPLPSVPGGNEMIQKLGTNLSQAVIGTKTPKQAISDATEQLESIMNS